MARKNKRNKEHYSAPPLDPMSFSPTAVPANNPAYYSGGSDYGTNTASDHLSDSQFCGYADGAYGSDSSIGAH